MMDDAASPPASLPRGFAWGAVRAGIKASGNLDLAAAVVTGTTPSAGIATGAVMYTSCLLYTSPWFGRDQYTVF